MIMQKHLPDTSNFQLFGNIFDKNIQKYKEFITFLKLYIDVNKDFVKKLSSLQNNHFSQLNYISLNNNANNNYDNNIDMFLSSFTNYFVLFVKEQITSIEQIITNLKQIVKQSNSYIEEQIELIHHIRNDFNNNVSELNDSYKQFDKINLDFQHEIESLEKHLIKYQKFKKKNKLPNNSIHPFHSEEDAINQSYSDISELFKLLNKDTNIHISNKVQSKNERYLESINNHIQSIQTKEKKFKNVFQHLKQFEQSFHEQSTNKLNTSLQINKDVMNHFFSDICKSLIFVNNSLKFLLAFVDSCKSFFTQSDYGDKSNEFITRQFHPTVLKDNNNNTLEAYKLITIEKFKTEASKQPVEGNNKSFINNMYIIGNLPIECMSEVKEKSKSSSKTFFTFEDMHFIIKTVYSVLTEKPNDDYYNIILEEKKILLNYICNKLLQNKDNLTITNDILPIVSMYLKEQNLRHFFLQKLNDLRSNGIFKFSKTTYGLFGKYLNEILSILNTSDMNDFYSVKSVIILSQTFYIINNENDNNKVYLQKEIQVHPLFKSTKFWKKFIEHSIEEEIGTSKLGNKGKATANNCKIDNIVFAQLVPLSDNMVEFGVPLNQIKEIIGPLIDKYSIQQVQKDMIYSILDSKESEKNK